MVNAFNILKFIIFHQKLYIAANCSSLVTLFEVILGIYVRGEPVWDECTRVGRALVCGDGEAALCPP